ncbi:MT-A70 family methyltransferase [Salipiger bermudensis]|nr:MT-A70 family methyltransferase [Salipiger bermudensis]
MRPAGGFGLIMVDPPWRFITRSSAGEAKAPQAHYSCMDLDAIARMPVGEIAARDCLLWLWAINPMLPQALEVLGAWGFTFKTAGTWVKRTKHGRDAFGTGYLLRSSNEPFLLGTRGAPKVTRSTRSTVASYAGAAQTVEEVGKTAITIEAELREHSRKPEEAYSAAEALMPQARRIEVFSRSSRPGWSTWGDEAGKFDAGGAVT